MSKRKPIRLEVEDGCLMDWSETDKRWTCYLFCWEVWRRHKRRVVRTVRARTRVAIGLELDKFISRRGVTLLTPTPAAPRGRG
jgi:hypothetical protein